MLVNPYNNYLYSEKLWRLIAIGVLLLTIGSFIVEFLTAKYRNSLHNRCWIKIEFFNLSWLSNHLFLPKLPTLWYCHVFLNVKTRNAISTSICLQHFQAKTFFNFIWYYAEVHIKEKLSCPEMINLIYSKIMHIMY
jgi:hypothetical protein